MYWKIQKLRWLIRWEFWKRCSLPPKITLIRVWNRGLWIEILLYYKLKNTVYFTSTSVKCKFNSKDLSMAAKGFKRYYARKLKNKQSPPFDARLGKKLE